MAKTEYNPNNAIAVKMFSATAGILIDSIEYGIDDYVRYTFIAFGDVASHHKAKIRYGAKKTTFRTSIGTMDLNDFVKV